MQKIPEELKNNPYKYICDWMEERLPYTGRSVFEVVSLLPPSLILPDFYYMGDIIRSNINVLIMTPPSGGKCLWEEEKVQLNDGRLVRIKDIKVGQKVVCLNEDTLKSETKDVLRVIENGIKDLYFLEVEDGRCIKVTHNHPFYTINGWKELKELNVGDFIATPRIIKASSKGNISEETARLLGYLIADGCVLDRIEFSNKNKKRLKDFVCCVNKFDNSLNINIQKGLLGKTSYRVSTERGKKNPLLDFSREIGLNGKNSFCKEVPSCIFESDNKIISSFLNSLFACDGHLRMKEFNGKRSSPIIEYYSNSKNLCLGVQTLLLRLGVCSSIKEKNSLYKKKPYLSYRVTIRGKKNAQRLIKETGYIVGKEKICKEIINYSCKDRANKDVIPYEVWKKIKKEKDERGLEWNEIDTIRGWKTNQSFRKHNINRFYLKNLKLEVAKKYAESEIFWNKIKSIKKCGKGRVYDLEIEENHNFVANNFFVHNSTIAKEFANVAFLPFEANSITPRKLEAEVKARQTLSFIVGDFSRMIKDQDVLKVIEGIIGEEKRLQRSTMRGTIDSSINAVGLFCGTNQDLSTYLTGGYIFRVVPIIITHTAENHSSIGKKITENIGSDSDFADKRDYIREFYQSLLDIQRGLNKDIPPIEKCHIDKKYAQDAYAIWDEKTKIINDALDVQLNWFRELQEFVRVLFSHAFLNIHNREIKNGTLYPNDDDFKVALSIMQRTLSVKYDVVSMSVFAKNIGDMRELQNIIKSNKMSEQRKNILTNLIHPQKKGRRLSP